MAERDRGSLGNARDQVRDVTMDEDYKPVPRADCRKADDGLYEVVVQTATAEMGFGPFSRAEADRMADALRSKPPAFLSAMETYFRRKRTAERSARVGRLRQMHRAL